MKIPVGISNHHAHLTKEVYVALFGDEPLTIKRNLKQPGEYASNQKINIEANNKQIENIRVVGPLRNYTQVELLEEDAEYLQINAPLRDSGNLKESSDLILKGPKGLTIVKECAIIANRHIHLPKNLQPNIEDKSIVCVKTKENKIINNVHIKISENYELEFHINKDDAMNFNLQNGEEVEIC